MSTSQVSNPALEFVNYFPRQLLTADDMRVADEYFREKLRRHNRILHGWGVVCGGKVELKTKWQVTVSKTYLITPRGDEVCIPEEITFDLASDSPNAYDPCPRPTPCSPAGAVKAAEGKTIYLAVCYSECNTRPVRIHPAGCGCGCDDSACEYSRVRESYELVCLDELPESHQKATDADGKLKKSMADYIANKEIKNLPIPDCPPHLEDCCVVLAKITLPAKQGDPINTIVDMRRPCLSTAAIALLIESQVRP